MSIDTKIYLDKFKPRDFQYELFDAFENKRCRKLVCVWPRRCLAGDTHIIMANGSWKELKNVSVGDEILSWDGERFEADIVEDWWKTEEKETIIIKTPSTLPTTSSMDHKFAYIRTSGKTLGRSGNNREIIKAPDWCTARTLNFKKLLTYPGIEGTINDPVLARNIGLNVNIDTCIDKRIWELDRESLLAFLGSVISNVGSFRSVFKKDYYHSVFEITGSLCKDFIFDVFWICKKLGLYIKKPVVSCSLKWVLRIVDAGTVEFLAENLTIENENIDEVLAQFLKRIDGLFRPVLQREFGCIIAKPCKAAKGEKQALYDIRTRKNHNFVANGHVVHNSGKDICAFNLMIREALRKVGVYYYIFPSYSQARKVIWDSMTNDGMRFLDFIPPKLVSKTNSQEMKIVLANGSLIQLIGSDNIDSIVGSNPRGCVFSEYAIQDPRAYQFIRPILAANGGWALFVSTPRGKNHYWELYQIALKSEYWYCSKLTLEDTGHIDMAEIERERKDGLMSEDLIQQEYYTSFTMGVEGAYYAKYIDKMRTNNQIGIVPWEVGFKVHTAWDIGVRDSTTILFFQTIGQTVRIIDSYENSKEGLEHYVNIIKNKPYTYGKHIAPHDIRVKEFGSGMTRITKARNLGLNFTISNNVSIVDGIESVRSSLSKIWIDQAKCKDFLKAIENYRQEYDHKRRVYKATALHDWSSHFADCLRYLCVSLPKTRDGLSPEELDKRYYEALYGEKSKMPAIFRDDYPKY